MINRRKKADLLIIVIFGLCIASVINIALQYFYREQFINQNYLYAGSLIAIFLSQAINPAYTDFEFKTITLSVNELTYLTPTWLMILEEFNPCSNPKVALFRYGKKMGNYFIPFSNIDPKINLMVVSHDKIRSEANYEKISYQEVGISTSYLNVAEEKIVLRLIKRKRKIPWYKILSPWGLEKYLKEGGYV